MRAGPSKQTCTEKVAKGSSLGWSLDGAGERVRDATRTGPLLDTSGAAGRPQAPDSSRCSIAWAPGPQIDKGPYWAGTFG